MEIPEETMQQVKATLKSYLPGLDNADVKMSRYQIGSSGSVRTDGQKQNKPKVLSDKVVVTVRNPVQIHQTRYFQIARITFDKKGSVVKVAMSR
jgi:hypothetical protein